MISSSAILDAKSAGEIVWVDFQGMDNDGIQTGSERSERGEGR